MKYFKLLFINLNSYIYIENILKKQHESAKENIRIAISGFYDIMYNEFRVSSLIPSPGVV